MGALELTIAIASPVISLATLSAGYYYFWHKNRRNRLRIKVDFQSLLGGGTPLQDLNIRYKDQPIGHPYVATVSLTNNGPKDLRSIDFENGKPLRIQLPGMIAAPLPLDDPEIETTGGEIHIKPGLLPKGKTFTIAVVADIPGPPPPDESGCAIVTPLANTDIDTKALIR